MKQVGGNRNDGVRIAIEAADLEALRTLVVADPAFAHENVSSGAGGKNVFPPLHLVCDVVFRRLVAEKEGLAMADVLLDAGVDPDQAYAKSGDTFLITAASLGAERIGLRFVELGADVERRGLFGATALHWAAFMGLDRLARALVVRGAELELADSQYDCTPLEWALHGWVEGTNGRRGGIPAVVRVLVGHGARFPAEVLATLSGDGDAELREALSAGGSR